MSCLMSLTPSCTWGFGLAANLVPSVTWQPLTSALPHLSCSALHVAKASQPAAPILAFKYDSTLEIYGSQCPMEGESQMINAPSSVTWMDRFLSRFNHLFRRLWASPVAPWWRNCLQCRCKRCRFNSWVGKIPWRRKWQPTPVFLPGKSHGERSLVGYSPWGQKS